MGAVASSSSALLRRNDASDGFATFFSTGSESPSTSCSSPKLSILEPKYQYLQELWLYVDSMTACLDSKMGLIEECEVQLLELEKSEAEAAAARRWLLLEDLADTLSDGASTAAHDTAGSSRSSKRVELDEFG
eukprot:COSAG06_NODE_18443_length_888_cov_0.659062_2_plen_132_part_01